MNEQELSQLIIGESAAMRDVRSLIATLAPLPSPVLIRGATGTGKELVALALHLLSGRWGPFVPVNITAMSDGMFESTIFGHVRGAFTSAFSDKDGYLTEAKNGTLFLDEIPDTPLTSQVKLLRVLEEGKHRPVGADRDRENDCRIVSATSEELLALVEEGRMREDLVERLSTFVIVLPPLAERRDDILAIAQHHAARFSQRDGTPTIRFMKGATAALRAYDWPRNVRELRNVVERLHALCKSRSVHASDVARALAKGRSAPTIRAIEQQRRDQLLAALEVTRWDTAKAAVLLGINRSTVYRRMHRLGIVLPRK
jgi:DNA-binding NtrC family response regulator